MIFVYPLPNTEILHKFTVYFQIDLMESMITRLEAMTQNLESIVAERSADTIVEKVKSG